MTPEVRAAVDAAVAEFDVSTWAPLDDHERDLVSRALVAPFPAYRQVHVPSPRPVRTSHSTPA
ncbi:hypothetical protein ACIGG9_16180 [Pseudonocardia alni]|uniref:hypothetical protein n=1 Tax=Pseudonocardia alni TaxID=33907 RepID=UPI0033DCF6DB